MMDEGIVREAIYRKYIEPTKKEREKYIGIEIEMPIINLNEEAVDFGKIHEITDRFISHFEFDEISRDDEGNIYNTTDSRTGDILSYDCSYNNLELSMGKAQNLDILNDRFNAYYEFLQNELKKSDTHCPVWELIPTEYIILMRRYQMEGTECFFII